jgi:hypothetical protein
MRPFKLAGMLALGWGRKKGRSGFGAAQTCASWWACFSNFFLIFHLSTTPIEILNKKLNLKILSFVVRAVYKWKSALMCTRVDFVFTNSGFFLIYLHPEIL